ncbi:MAG: lysophospholipid acyltransferase family protein [Balneolaceae bacterium]
MKHVRATFKILFTVLYTGTICAIYLILLIPATLFGIPYEPLRNFFMSFWSRGMLLVFNVKKTVSGEPPKPPFFLVSNHLSYLDVIVYYSILKTTFIAKMDVKSWPVLGFLIKSMGVIFIDRKRRRDVQRVNKMISSNLNSFQGIILFPEGTTSPGETVLPFRAPLLEFPASNDIPVHYASIRYDTGDDDIPAYRSVCWWGEADFFQHLYNLAKLKKIKSEVIFGAESIHENDRKLLASSLYKSVNNSFRAMARPGEVAEYNPPEFLSGIGNERKSV